MWNEIILMMHPTAGVLGVLAAVWVFVETVNASDQNRSRIRTASIAATGFIWLAYVVGGYWYVVFYATDKALINSGSWPFAHGFVMETKEHVFLMLLLVATYLPIAAFSDLRRKGTRTMVLWSAALVVLMGLAMEGAGALVAMGVKVALLAG